MSNYSLIIKIELIEQLVSGDKISYKARINDVKGILDIPALVTNKIKYLYNTLSKPKPASDVSYLRANIEFESKQDEFYDVIENDELTQLLIDEYTYVTPEDVIDDYNENCKFKVFNDISTCHLYIRTKDKEGIVSTDDALHIDIIELYKREDLRKVINIADIISKYVQLHEQDELSALCCMIYKGTSYDKEVNPSVYFSRRYDMESEEILFTLFCELTDN